MTFILLYCLNWVFVHRLSKVHRLSLTTTYSKQHSVCNTKKYEILVFHIYPAEGPTYNPFCVILLSQLTPLKVQQKSNFEKFIISVCYRFECIIIDMALAECPIIVDFFLFFLNSQIIPFTKHVCQNQVVKFKLLE